MWPDDELDDDDGFEDDEDGFDEETFSWELALLKLRGELIGALGYAGLGHTPPVKGFWPGLPRLDVAQANAVTLALGWAKLQCDHDAFLIWELMHDARRT
jgi:hypothetical protein